MSTAIPLGSIGGADHLLLRWSDNPELPTQEEPVKMVEAHISESIVRSSLRVSERTQVHLIGKHYTGNGIVQSCQSDGNEFILMTTSPSLPAPLDPGVFAINSFLTEEEELKILENLSNGR